MTEKEIDDAWKQMGGTAAGRVARAKLVDLLMRVAPIHAANPSALLVEAGVRTLARELLTLLDAEHVLVPGSDPDANLRADLKPVGRRGSRGVERRVPFKAPG